MTQKDSQAGGGRIAKIFSTDVYHNLHTFYELLAVKIIKNVTYSVSNFGVVKIFIWQIVTRWKVCHARKLENFETI